MTEQSVIAVYDRISKAEVAVHALEQKGFPAKQLSLVSQTLESDKHIHGYITTDEDQTKRSARSGAWAGGLFGLLTGAAFLWIPGFGPLMIAGRLAAVLLGSIEGALLGAAGGGLIGALVNCGVADQHVSHYEEQLMHGKCLVIAHGSAEDVDQAFDILQDTDAESINIHAEAAA